jgi:hypothetical protein
MTYRCKSSFAESQINIDRVSLQRLVKWFANHRSAKSDLDPSTLPWLPLLQRLHQIRNPRPHKRSTVQQFMFDYPKELKAALAIRCPDPSDLNSAQRLNMRFDVGKALYTSDYSHLKEQLDEKAAAQHDTDAEEWSLELEDISSSDDVSQYVVLLYFQAFDLRMNV